MTHFSRFSRREFFATSAGMAGALAGRASWANEKSDAPVAFALVGDTHYLANKDEPTELDERSAGVTSQLIDTLNSLSGREISEMAGGGRVASLKGVIHAGDLIDSGDKTGPLQFTMQQREWTGFTTDFGLTGSDGRLKLPVYEVHGNHDGPRGEGLAIDGIRERNKRRPDVSQVSANGQHYSWDWGPVHFVNLGIVVGGRKDVSQKRRYNPLDSLEFLVSDLRDRVGTSGRPIVLTHHIDIVRYSKKPDLHDPANEKMEWHPADVRGFYEALHGYNVAAILYGHTHARNVLKWNGTSERATEGVDLFNVDNSAHFHNDQQALLYFEIRRDELLVRELATVDRWQSSSWTPQVWRQPLRT